MSKRDEKILVEDILEAASKIQRYLENVGLDEFLSDDKTQDAVVRNYGIIGEATSKLPTSFREKHPIVEWHKLIAIRNRLIHDYIGVDYVILWKIAKENIPDLISQLRNLLSS